MPITSRDLEAVVGTEATGPYGPGISGLQPDKAGWVNLRVGEVNYRWSPQPKRVGAEWVVDAIYVSAGDFSVKRGSVEERVGELLAKGQKAYLSTRWGSHTFTSIVSDPADIGPAKEQVLALVRDYNLALDHIAQSAVASLSMLGR